MENAHFILAVEKRSLRYSELKRTVGKITHKMLSTQLKELEADGLLSVGNIHRYRQKWNILCPSVA